MTNLTLVLGSTGKTGSRIVERLERRGIAVRAGSRSATPAFDWEDRSTWGPALDGTTAVYVSYFPDLAIPGAADLVGEFARLAAPRRLVLLSGRGEPEAQRAEQLVREASPEATIVRCAWFAQNFSESFLAEPIAYGAVFFPARDVREPFVDAEDIADVAVAALTEPGHEGKLYELTGPRLLTFEQAVQEIAGATGREISYTPIAVDDLMAAMEGEREDLVWLVRYLVTEVLDGRNERLANGVREALGREPRDFAAYAETLR
jgi:uncharacterized protein YbjT (DUF2867 family)